MSTARIWETTSTSFDDTVRLAEQIGRKLRGGEIIELVGDLGAGKTAFVRGLAKGLESTDLVRSPSFTIGNQYKGANLTLYHFDFHRLSDAGIMRDELAELLSDPLAVIAVEWAELIADVLPADRLIMYLRPTDENGRQIRFEYPDSFAYLINNVHTI